MLPERVSAIDTAGAALAPYWWAFAGRGLIALIAGGAFLAGIDASALPETAREGQTIRLGDRAWPFPDRVWRPALVPGFGAASEIKLWRVFIAESAVLIAAGLVRAVQRRRHVRLRRVGLLRRDADLGRAAAGRRVRARPSPLGEVGWRWRRSPR